MPSIKKIACFKIIWHYSSLLIQHHLALTGQRGEEVCGCINRGLGGG